MDDGFWPTMASQPPTVTVSFEVTPCVDWTWVHRPFLAGSEYVGHRIDPSSQVRDYAVILLTIRRTQGATMATVGKATGQVVTQLLSHCAGNSEFTPCETARTKAETMQTIMAESKALKRIGAKRAGIRM